MERKINFKHLNKFYRVFLACLFISFGMSTQAQAGEGNCVSLFSKIADQFNKVVPTYIDIRMEAAEVLLGVVLPDAELDELTDKMKQAQIDAYKAVGEIVGDKNSPGAVNMTVPYHKYSGKSYVERTFYVSNSGFDQVNVKVKKTGGKNGADIIVCKYATEGGYIKTKTASFNKGKDTTGQQRTIEFKGMKNDKYLTIHVVNKGFAADKFDYELTVTGEFDTEKLAAEKSVKPVLGQAIKHNTTIDPVMQRW